MSDEMTRNGAAIAEPQVDTGNAFDDIAGAAVDKMFANSAVPGAAPETSDTLDASHDPESADDVLDDGGLEGIPMVLDENPDPEDAEGAQNKGRDTISVKSFEKRMGKATKRIKGLEAENAQLRDQSKRKTSYVDPSNPVATATTTAELDALGEQADLLSESIETLLIQVKRDPEGVIELLEKQGVQTDDPEVYLETTRHNLAKVVNRVMPQRREFVTARERSSQEAAATYTWLNDETDPRTAWVDAEKAKYPGAAAIVPDLDLLLARSLLGRQMEVRDRQKRQSTPTRQATRPASAGLPRKGRRTDPVASGFQEALKTGDSRPAYDALAETLMKKAGMLGVPT
tara:strand:- start:1130 stop:2161 length:1032 start_codon:yes stop_codon:yes gene_type:complete